jgi:hypothetical protein
MSVGIVNKRNTKMSEEIEGATVSGKCPKCGKDYIHAAHEAFVCDCEKSDSKSAKPDAKTATDSKAE